MAPPLIAVVAMTPDGVIGRDGDMPWRLSSDLRRFKRTTMDGALLMGRKTYESIGRPLPGRLNIVVTGQADWNADGVTVVTGGQPAENLERALAIGRDHAVAHQSKVFVVGGAEMYRQLIGDCDELWLTRVWSSVQGDTRLELDLTPWQTVEKLRQPSGPRDNVPIVWQRMTRRRP